MSAEVHDLPPGVEEEKGAAGQLCGRVHDILDVVLPPGGFQQPDRPRLSAAQDGGEPVIELQQVQTGDGQVDLPLLCASRQAGGVPGGKKGETGEIFAPVQQRQDIRSLADPERGGIGTVETADEADGLDLGQGGDGCDVSDDMLLHSAQPMGELRHDGPSLHKVNMIDGSIITGSVRIAMLCPCAAKICALLLNR